jgi:hypothetical protein
MAVYFARYVTARTKEYQHQAPTEWITSYGSATTCGTEHNQNCDQCTNYGCVRAQLINTDH